MKKRLDTLIFELGLASSRTMAQRLIEQQLVCCREDLGIRLKPSSPIHPSLWSSESWTVSNSKLSRYVSRGGLKLEGALRHFNISCSGLNAWDIGQSTGGFTDCLIQYGAGRVFGIDVGRGQLHPSLKENPQVFAVEGVNIKESLDSSFFQDFFLEENPALFDLVVGDLSFISVKKVMPNILPHIKKGGQILFLIKPQFEVGRQSVGKKGVVKNQKKVNEVLSSLEKQFSSWGLRFLGKVASEVLGDDGNQEYFFWSEV